MSTRADDGPRPTSATANLKEFGGTDRLMPKSGEADRLPPASADDPNGGDEAPRSAPPEDRRAPEEPASRPQHEPPVNERDRIAAKFRRQRAEENLIPLVVDDGTTAPFARQAGEPLDDIPDQEDNEGDRAADLSAEPAAEGDKPPTAPVAPETFHLKVNGKTVPMTRDQMIAAAGLSAEEAEGLPVTSIQRAAQMNEAAKIALADAKDQRRATRAPDQERADGTETDQDPVEHGAPADPLTEAVEKIQFGTPEEGRAALAKAISAGISHAQVEQRMAESADETTNSIAAFSRENADLASQKPLLDMTFVMAMNGIKDEIVRIGAGSREEVDNVITTPEIAAQVYRNARARGLKVKAPGEILNEAGTFVRTHFMGGQRPAAAPQGNSPARADRLTEKRGLPTQTDPSHAARTSLEHRTRSARKIGCSSGNEEDEGPDGSLASSPRSGGQLDMTTGVTIWPASFGPLPPRADTSTRTNCPSTCA